ncbi:MAG: PP2C family serine/threonine-protein phosphatase [Granulosicoccus sp.]
MKQKLVVVSAGVSDVGRQRQHNEDSLTSSDELGLYAIADGMGGHAQGDVASQVAIDTLLHEVENHLRSGNEVELQEACYETIDRAIASCNENILERNRQNKYQVGEGMGTTLVGTYFLKNRMKALTFNVGDSRIYRLRRGNLKQLTRDHTMYQAWIEAGGKGSAPSKSILVNAVGLVEDLLPDIKLESVVAGDLYLICSDGLSSLVDDHILKESLCANCRLPPDVICQQLIELANQNGGSDNITVIIVRIDVEVPVESDVLPEDQVTRIQNESV